MPIIALILVAGGFLSENHKSKEVDHDPPANVRAATRRWAKRYRLSEDEIPRQERSTLSGLENGRLQRREVESASGFSPKAIGIPKGSSRTALVMRSGQPAPEHLVELVKAAKAISVKPEEILVVNLRHENRVEREYVETAATHENADIRAMGGIRVMDLPIIDHTIPRPAQVRRWLRSLKDPQNKVVLVHCKAGIARTSTMVALMRIIMDGWTVDRAVSEARDNGMTRPLQERFIRTLAQEWREGAFTLEEPKGT